MQPGQHKPAFWIFHMSTRKFWLKISQLTEPRSLSPVPSHTGRGHSLATKAHGFISWPFLSQKLKQTHFAVTSQTSWQSFTSWWFILHNANKISPIMDLIVYPSYIIVRPVLRLPYLSWVLYNISVNYLGPDLQYTTKTGTFQLIVKLALNVS